MKKNLFFISLISGILCYSQNQYPETQSPSNMALGVYYQNGPGSNNSLGWQYNYGTKLTVNVGASRNFEMTTTTYPNGLLKLRQWDPTNSVWTSWRDILTTNQDGKVGIGTTSPSNKLEVNGTIGAQDLLVVQKGGSYLVALNGQNDGYISGRNSSFEHKFQIASNGNTYFNGGNLGIGTSTPRDKLTILGGIFSISDNAGGETPFRFWAGSSGSNNQLRIGTDIGHTGDAVVELYQNYSGGNEQNPGKLIVNGNLGIGIKNPDAKLAVNGNIHAKEVKVDLIGWPDYVFEKKYQLPTLQEVEAHIEEKGHLQNIPSAQEVEENGIKLGEMNSKLLQKIEELMLYTIQQQKEIEELKKQNIQLQDDIQVLKQK